MAASSQDRLICPITLEEIVIASCTCFGFIYEETAIRKWVETHDIEPMTGQVLPTLKICRLGPTSYGDIESMKRSAKEIAQTTQKSMAGQIGSVGNFDHTKIFYQSLLEQKKIIAQLPSDVWKEFNRAKRAAFVHRYVNPYMNQKIAKKQDAVRPQSTGVGYQHIKLRSISKYQSIFKYENFDGADLTGCRFTECHFSHVTFVGANLTNCRFKRCTFIGDRNSFYKAQGIPVFINCKIEPVGVWMKVNSLNDVAYCLQQRGMKKFEVRVSYIHT